MCGHATLRRRRSSSSGCSRRGRGELLDALGHPQRAPRRRRRRAVRDGPAAVARGRPGAAGRRPRRRRRRGAHAGAHDPPLHGAPYVLFLYDDEAAIRGLAPDLGAMTANVVATASPAGAPYDFVSRWFGPLSGIPEDPVTGSAHSTLAPFWAERLGKPRLDAKQLSARGGGSPPSSPASASCHRRRLHVLGGDDPRAGVGRSGKIQVRSTSRAGFARGRKLAPRKLARHDHGPRQRRAAHLAADVAGRARAAARRCRGARPSKMQEVPMHAWEVLNVFPRPLRPERKALLGVGGLGGLRSLVGMTADPDPATQSKAASAFVSLLELAARGMEELPDAQLQAVVHLAGKYTPRTRAHAAVAIGNAALSSATREKLVACGGLKALLELAAVDDAEVQAAALALALLSQRRRARRCRRGRPPGALLAPPRVAPDGGARRLRARLARAGRRRPRRARLPAQGARDDHAIEGLCPPVDRRAARLRDRDRADAPRPAPPARRLPAPPHARAVVILGGRTLRRDACALAARPAERCPRQDGRARPGGCCSPR